MQIAAGAATVSVSADMHSGWSGVAAASLWTWPRPSLAGQVTDSLPHPLFSRRISLRHRSTLQTLKIPPAERMPGRAISGSVASKLTLWRGQINSRRGCNGPAANLVNVSTPDRQSGPQLGAMYDHRYMKIERDSTALGAGSLPKRGRALNVLWLEVNAHQYP